MKTKCDNYVTHRKVWSMSKMKLSCCDWSNQVRFVTKTREDNYVTNHVGLIHIKIETKLLGPIWPYAICDEN